MSVNSKMTAIADPIRSLMGLTGTLGLDAMASNLSSANGQVTDQTALIAQIIEAAEGKAAGGGGYEVVTFTPASNVTSYTIPNPFGVTSLGVLAIGESFAKAKAVTNGIFGIFGNEGASTKRGYIVYTSYTALEWPVSSSGGYTLDAVTAESITLKGGYYNSVFVAGMQYIVIIAKDGVFA